MSYLLLEPDTNPSPATLIKSSGKKSQNYILYHYFTRHRNVEKGLIIDTESSIQSRKN